MNKIDTEYTSLDQVNPQVVQFYEEEQRERIVGSIEGVEGTSPRPITEPYTVVVLNKPDTVTYDNVAQRRGERKAWEPTVKAELERAIIWEDFVVNHDGYLAWLEAHTAWQEHSPEEYEYEDESEFELAQRDWLERQPVRPVADIATSREHYELTTTEIDTNLFTSDESTVEYDDANLVAICIPLLVDKPTHEVIAYNEKCAINTRYDAVYAPLAMRGSFIDIGRGKDGVFGINNVKDTVMGYDAGLTGLSSVLWIMTDNSVMELTIQDLRQIIIEFNLRKQSIFMAYGYWRASDRTISFSIEE